MLMNSGSHRHWEVPQRYQNQDPRGQMHFPGYSAAAARMLIEERGAQGFGLNTMRIDYGLSRDFPGP